MKNIFVLFVLFSLAIFTSCDKEELADEHLITYEADIENVGEVNFTIDNRDNTVFEKDALLLTNNSVNAVSYHWDFGNGDTSSEAQPDYDYKIHGYYNITLTITDVHGNTEHTSNEILVLCVFAEGNHDF